MSRSIDAAIMSDRENGEMGIAPHELYLRSNPSLLKIDVTNPREWYKNGEKILTTAYDKNLNTGQVSKRNNGRYSLDAGVRSNGGLLLPSVYNRRNEVNSERSRNKLEKGRSGGVKAFPFLNHVTNVRYTSEPSLNALDMNGNTEGDEGHVDSWADVKENVPDKDQFFEKRNGLPLLKNGGHHSNGTVSDSELESVVFYQKKRQPGIARRGFRSMGGKISPDKSKNLYPKQRSILHDTINFEQYKLKQKSILKLKFPEADPNQKAKPRPYMYNFQYAVPVEPDYSHIQSKIGALIRPHGKAAPTEEASAPRDPPTDTDVPDYSPRGYTPNAKFSFGLDILNSDEIPAASSTPSIKEGHYVYKAPDDGYYQRSISHDGTRTAIVNLALGKDVRSTPSEGLSPFLQRRYRRRKVDSGYTSSTPATEYSSWDERSIIDYEVDDELRSGGQSRLNGAGSAASRYTNLKSAGSFKSNLGARDNQNDIETNGDNQGCQSDVDSPSRLDSPSKKSVRFSHAEVKTDGLISPSKLGLPRTPGGRPKSVLKKFNKIEVFGEKSYKKANHDKESLENSEETVVTSAKPRYTSATRPPVYRLEKSVSHDDSSSEKLNSKSGDEDDEYMTRVANLGSPTESKMVEIVESYRRYLDQGDSEDPTPRRVDNADGMKLHVKMGDAKADDQTHSAPAQGNTPAEADDQIHSGPAQGDTLAEADDQTHSGPAQGDTFAEADDQTQPAPAHAQGDPAADATRHRQELDTFFKDLLSSNPKEGANTNKDAAAKTAEKSQRAGLEPSGSQDGEARKADQTTPEVLAGDDNHNAKESNEGGEEKKENEVSDRPTSVNAVNNQPVLADEAKTTGQTELTEVTVAATTVDETNDRITPQNEQTSDDGLDGNDVRGEIAMATDEVSSAAMADVENNTGDVQANETGHDNETREDANGNV